MLERELGEVDEMRRTKNSLLFRLHYLLGVLPHGALERLHKFLVDSSITGDITFAFHRGRVLGWSSKIGPAYHKPELDEVIK